MALGGHQGGDEAVGQAPGRVLEGLGHGLTDAGSGHHVGLGRVAVPGGVAHVIDAEGPGEGGHPAGGVDQADLAHLASLVGGADPVQGVGSREAIGQQVQAAGPVARVDHRLGGHGADAGPGPGQHRAEGEIATLGGHAELAAVGVAGDDGVRHDTRRSVQRGEEGQQGGVGLARVLLLDPVAGPLHEVMPRKSGSSAAINAPASGIIVITGSSEPVRNPVGMV